MNDSHASRDPLDPVTSELTAFYAKQAHLIDMGEHRAWAKTFLPEGEFHSPTYSAPAVGHDALTEISRSFAATAQAAGEVHRHVVTNLWVLETDRTTARIRAYLLVVASGPDAVRILRVVTLHDDVVDDGGQWRVRRRQVSHGTGL